MANRIPPELWSHIFDIAADEDVIFFPGLPTKMSQSSWYKHVAGRWKLRTPQDAINIIQRRSYFTKKSIIRTCKSWHRLGVEFLVRCLFFDNPRKLSNLRSILARDPKLGWWTRRLHVTRFSAGAGRGGSASGMDAFEEPLIDIIARCPNIEIFVVDLPMSHSFGPIADTLGNFCHKLRTVHWHVPLAQLPKVIWALESLPQLISVHLDFDGSEILALTRANNGQSRGRSGESSPARSMLSPGNELVPLGAAQDIGLTLPSLQQLSLSGHCQAFLEQAAGWSLPMLRSFSFDFKLHSEDVPDVTVFLQAHGSDLLFLDLNCIPSLDVRTILDLCPQLHTFGFNPDWKISSNPNPTVDDEEDEEDDEDDDPTLPAALTRRPHPNITNIGLHGLMYAFGVGVAAAFASRDPLGSMLTQRANDRNFSALTKANFPKLQLIRVLSTSVLEDLERADGPGERGGYERWEKWWDKCSRMGVKLEDCTGAPLGTLPQDPQQTHPGRETSEDLASDEEWEYEDYEEYEEEGGGAPAQGSDKVGIEELRELLEECRQLWEEKDDPPVFGPMVLINGQQGPAPFR
ncbi:hypothetical protein CONPUDRAFT_168355 [Coniophora puteana RWD-64-598 SS2]|uniref:Uncharacterized protein n=1 Tax=Coniophora puteana (strain RWD-64-598) TaxID=741705 RepID=A0A5M3MEF3_CONPW|nr:uncharacterized protein CONPUDRAFT_168355 [Coniophora puteana RWD-64-598 SS2]EIW77427.1 hypothetical protein CONPUDRAFT_168355 [Coniophora puteana RWD-64-598 SS2]